ncbi:hypothetical protein CSHISOI_06014, partial [Colletotrichum shisoi]
MEVLSGVSSGFAVVSLALQLAEKVTKTHDFWRSVRGAPDELGSIAAELEFLERVYIGIAHNAQRETIDPILTKALEAGQQEVTRFEALVSPLRKRCENESKIKRKWASLVAGVWRKEEVAEFRDSISRTKSTLLMALQASVHIGFCKPETQSSDIKEIKEQLAGMQSLIARMAHSFPDAVRTQLVEDMDNEVREFSKDAIFSENSSSADSPALNGANRSDGHALQ